MKAEPAAEIVWIYGSRAKGHYQENSEFDLAIAFKTVNQWASKNNDYCNKLAYC